jgi:hypothetical protein
VAISQFKNKIAASSGFAPFLAMTWRQLSDLGRYELLNFYPSRTPIQKLNWSTFSLVIVTPGISTCGPFTLILP